MNKNKKILVSIFLSLTMFTSCNHKMIDGALTPISIPENGVIIDDLKEFKSLILNNSKSIEVKDSLGFSSDDGYFKFTGSLSVDNIKASNIYQLNISNIKTDYKIVGLSSNNLDDLKASVSISYDLEFTNNMKGLNNLLPNLNLPSTSISKSSFTANYYLLSNNVYADLTGSKKVIDLYAEINNSLFTKQLTASNYYKFSYSLSDLSNSNENSNLIKFIDSIFNQNSKLNKYLNENYKLENRTHGNNVYSTTAKETVDTYTKNVKTLFNKTKYNDYFKSFAINNNQAVNLKKLVFVADNNGPKYLGSTSYIDACFNIQTPIDKGVNQTVTLGYVKDSFNLLNRDDAVNLKEFIDDKNNYHQIVLNNE